MDEKLWNEESGIFGGEIQIVFFMFPIEGTMELIWLSLPKKIKIKTEIAHWLWTADNEYIHLFKRNTKESYFFASIESGWWVGTWKVLVYLLDNTNK